MAEITREINLIYTIEQLEYYYNTNKHNFDSIHFSIICNKIFKIKNPSKEIFVDSINEWLKIPNSKKYGRNLANLIHLCTKIQINTIINKLINKIKYFYKSFNAQDTATTIWSFAKLNINDCEIIGYLKKI